MFGVGSIHPELLITTSTLPQKTTPGVVRNIGQIYNTFVTIFFYRLESIWIFI